MMTVIAATIGAALVAVIIEMAIRLRHYRGKLRSETDAFHARLRILSRDVASFGAEKRIVSRENDVLKAELKEARHLVALLERRTERLRGAVSKLWKRLFEKYRALRSLQAAVDRVAAVDDESYKVIAALEDQNKELIAMCEEKNALIDELQGRCASLANQLIAEPATKRRKGAPRVQK